MNIIIREIKPEDVKDVVDIARKTGMGNCNWVASCAEKPKPGEYLLVGIKDNEVISLIYALLRKPPYGFIAMVATHSDYRRLGVGTKILGKILARAKEDGFSIVGVSTGQDNVAGMNLYKKLGFVLAYPLDDSLVCDGWIEPDEVYLINPISFPIIDDLKARHPYLQARIGESLVNINGENYVCLRWYDVISKEQIALFYKTIHEGWPDDVTTIFNLVKMDIYCPSIKRDLIIQTYGLSPFIYHGDKASVGIIIENRGNVDFEYKFDIELSLALTVKEQFDTISGKIKPKGKITHNYDIEVLGDAQADTLQVVYFKNNYMMPFSAVTRIKK